MEFLAGKFGTKKFFFFFFFFFLIDHQFGKTECLIRQKFTALWSLDYAMLSDFWKLTLPLHLGKYYLIHKTGENKAIFGLGMPPVTGGKTGQIKSLLWND